MNKSFLHTKSKMVVSSLDKLRKNVNQVIVRRLMHLGIKEGVIINVINSIPGVGIVVRVGRSKFGIASSIARFIEISSLDSIRNKV
ncbi:MAG: FeoA family protein [Proteobacteria bacterium]|nr:FeoA family protein [Pseudomonadota bacterium]